MGISRWGSRVEEIMSTPVPEPTFYDKLHAAMAEEERTQTETHMTTWFAKQLSQRFRTDQMVVRVTFQPGADGFLAVAAFTYQAHVYTGKCFLPERDVITASSDDVHTWRRFLNKQGGNLANDLRRAMKAAGVNTIEPSSTYGSSTYSTGMFAKDDDRHVDPREEQAAIDAVMASMRELEE